MRTMTGSVALDGSVVRTSSRAAFASPWSEAVVRVESSTLSCSTATIVRSELTDCEASWRCTDQPCRLTRATSTPNVSSAAAAPLTQNGMPRADGLPRRLRGRTSCLVAVAEAALDRSRRPTLRVPPGTDRGFGAFAHYRNGAGTPEEGSDADDRVGQRVDAGKPGGQVRAKIVARGEDRRRRVGHLGLAAVSPDKDLQRQVERGKRTRLHDRRSRLWRAEDHHPGLTQDQPGIGRLAAVIDFCEHLHSFRLDERAQTRHRVRHG